MLGIFRCVVCFWKNSLLLILLGLCISDIGCLCRLCRSRLVQCVWNLVSFSLLVWIDGLISCCGWLMCMLVVVVCDVLVLVLCVLGSGGGLVGCLLVILCVGLFLCKLWNIVWWMILLWVICVQEILYSCCGCIYCIDLVLCVGGIFVNGLEWIVRGFRCLWIFFRLVVVKLLLILLVQCSWCFLLGLQRLSSKVLICW